MDETHSYKLPPMHFINDTSTIEMAPERATNRNAFVEKSAAATAATAAMFKTRLFSSKRCTSVQQELQKPRFSKVLLQYYRVLATSSSCQVTATVHVRLARLRTVQ